MKFREVSTLPLLLAVAACGEARSGEVAPQAPIVRTVLVSAAALDTDSYTGVVRARVESDLGFRVPGKIVARSVDVGQTVRAGQILARLDATDFALGAQTASAQAQAAGDQAEAASPAGRRGAGGGDARGGGRAPVARAGERGRGVGTGVRSGARGRPSRRRRISRRRRRRRRRPGRARRRRARARGRRAIRRDTACCGRTSTAWWWKCWPSRGRWCRPGKR
jgi:multidrug efflux pump subunit AcrA (membrane-fusion protein)